MRGQAIALTALVSSSIACSSPTQPTETPAPADARDEVTRDVKRYVDGEVRLLAEAVRALAEHAPTPDADGWSLEADRDAVDRMRADWRRARAAYEHVEGAIAILFPETDADIDDRYERVAELTRDDRPFDGVGFIGMHAVERVLWSESQRPEVIAFESTLHGYVAPRTPHDVDEATAFRDGLVARLVTDVSAMEQALGPLALDAATAYRGIQGSLEEQLEKLRLDAIGQSESRYADTTLADMRANVEGGARILEAFAPLVRTLADGEPRQRLLAARWGALVTLYGEGDAMPPMPPSFRPSAPDEATRYGRLYVTLEHEADLERAGSLARELVETGQLLTIPPLRR